MHPSLLKANGVRRAAQAPATTESKVVSRASPRPATPIRRCSNYAVAY